MIVFKYHHTVFKLFGIRVYENLVQIHAMCGTLTERSQHFVLETSGSVLGHFTWMKPGIKVLPVDWSKFHNRYLIISSVAHQSKATSNGDGADIGGNLDGTK